VALWLQEAHGVEALFERMEKLSTDYQSERSNLESTDPTRLTILALRQMFSQQRVQELEFETSTLAEVVNQVAVKKEVVDVAEDFTNARRTGRLLERLRLRKAQRTAKRKRWKVSWDELIGLARVYGMVRDRKQNGTQGTNGKTAQEEVPSCQECHECQDVSDMPSQDDGVRKEVAKDQRELKPWSMDL
jgi:hypothetical protein